MLQLEVLETLAGATNYIGWLASLTEPHLGENPIEVGSGLGDYAAVWLENGLPQITVTENDPALVTALHDRFDADQRVTVRELDVLHARPAGYSAAVMLNVLEHISDDVAALAAARSLAETVVVIVPAFPFAMSRFDRQLGHHRRYTRESLRRAANEAGLAIDMSEYVNMPGLVAWTVGMKLLRLQPRAGRLLSLWDRLVVPAARRLEQGRHSPFGQSLLLVAR